MSSTQAQFNRGSRFTGLPLLSALAENWWLLLLRGIAAIVFGILALFGLASLCCHSPCFGAPTRSPMVFWRCGRPFQVREPRSRRAGGLRLSASPAYLPDC